MRKTIVAIFAHPDDEAFGPGGTLAQLALTNDVYLITATGGEAGQCSLEEPIKNLSSVRKKELLTSAKILGIKKVFFLGFEDGTLSNNLYHRLAQEIENIIKPLTPDTLLTFEPHGVSGHIDHITISLVTTYLHTRKNYGKELWFYCISKNARKREPDDYFIYFPEGYSSQEIDITMNVKDVWQTRVAAIHAHASQKHDGETILKALENLPKEEYFLLHKK